MTQSNDLEDYDIRCPYVIIVGQATYKNKALNLEGVKSDVANMTNLFLKEFKYEYIRSQLDELPGEKKITDKTIDEYLKAQQKQIDLINSENKQKKVLDALIFIYSGHGTLDDNLLCSDESEYPISKIQELFNNDNCKGLNGMPKIFMYDCCRGQNMDQKLGNKTQSNDNSNPRGNTKEKVKIDVKKLTSSTTGDQCCWFATTNEYVALENNKEDGIPGGFFISEVYLYFLYMLKEGYYHDLQGTIATVINKRIPIVSDYKQTPEFINKLRHMLHFLPSDKSKYKVDKNNRKNLKYNSKAITFYDLLNAWGLGYYVGTFGEHGYDNMDKWSELDKKTCKEKLGMKGGHARRFLTNRDLYYLDQKN